MFSKSLVLALFVSAAFASDHHYPLKSHKEYRHPYEHQIQVHEPSSEEYTPENQGHAYSSQSLVHQGHSVAYQESHESNADQQAPVYQYQVDEHNEDAAVHAPVQHNHAHYPQHEIQTVRVPAHHKIAYYPESHGVHKAPVYHHPESYVHKAPYNPESHEGQHQNVHYQPESHEAPAYLAVPHAPVHTKSHDAHDEPVDYYAYPKYQYEYQVDDPHTGDNKFQHEIRDGDVVKGIYGLHEADGSYRTVEYSSDKHHGFTAVVKHSAPGQHVHIESHHPNEASEHEN